MVARRIVSTLLLTLIASAWPAAQTPRIDILAPRAGELVENMTLVRVRLDPAALFTRVEIFVGPRLICERIGPPFECEFDAGREFVRHQVRVRGYLKSGGPPLTRTIETGDLQYAETAKAIVVQVPVLVTRGGQFIRGLSQEVFRVYDEGRRQEITSFAAEDTSLEVVVAIDVSGSVQPVLPRIKEAAKAFLGALPSTNSVTLLGFNGEIFTLATRETDAAARMAAVDSLTAFGTTALYDVVLHSLDLLAKRTGRKALVLFSDGEDRGSVATLADVEQAAQRSDAAIYTVGMGRGNEVADLLKVLARIADPTGGRSLQANSIDRLRDTFREVLEELSHQYLIGFVPATGPEGEWRRIRVEVDGYRVRAREGYAIQGK